MRGRIVKRGNRNNNRPRVCRNKNKQKNMLKKTENLYLQKIPKDE